jgi:serine protease Do
MLSNVVCLAWDLSWEGGGAAVTEQDKQAENCLPALEDKYVDQENGYEFSDEELQALFQRADEEGEGPPPFVRSPRFRKIVAGLLAAMLFANVLAFLPQFFSLAAIRFIAVSAQLSQSEEVKAYKQSVVVIRAGKNKGTGFVIEDDGLIVTNRHVINDTAAPAVHFQNGERYIARVVAIDDTVDLALLDIEAEGLPVLSLAKDSGKEGDPIYVIGNPLVFNGIANEGESWGLIPVREEAPPMLALQAPIYKGNSGSPVIRKDGQVIGVVYATSSMERDGERHRIGLAVPIEWVRKRVSAFKNES